MSWWKKAKQAVGIEAQDNPEIADQYEYAKALDKDKPLQGFIRKMVENHTGLPDEELISIYSPGSSEAIPEGLRERRNWIRTQIVRAFQFPKTRQIYKCDDFLTTKIATVLRREDVLLDVIPKVKNIHNACDIIATNVARRYVSLYSTGTVFLKRMNAETEYLSKMEDHQIYQRFSGMPHSRIDPIPALETDRRKWIEEVLIGESACVRLGMVPRDTAYNVSQRINAGLPEVGDAIPAAYLEAATTIHGEHSPWAYYSDMAARFSDQSDDFLRKKFAKIPNMNSVTIPKSIQERTEWIKIALSAEHIRKSAGLEINDAKHVPKATVLSIEFLGITIHSTNSQGISFEGSLYIDGYRICDIISPGNAQIEAFGWNEGCSIDDLQALSVYIKQTGAPRENGRKDSLYDRLLDQITMHVALERYRKAREKSVMYLPNGTESPVEIMRVDIPENGTRSGAVSHIRKTNPEAVILDDIEEEDAAMIWTVNA